MSSSALAAPPERKLSLAEITEQLTAWRDTLEGLADDHGDAELIRAKLEQLDSLHANKVDAYCAFAKWLASEQSGLKSDKQRFDRRQQQYKRLEDQRYDGVRALMVANGISQMKGRAFTITLCDGRKRLEITDPALIPLEYKSVSVTMPAAAWRKLYGSVAAEDRADMSVGVSIDEAQVEAALKRGEEVTGARMADGEPYVQIR